jgi:hypothetical protein
MIFEASDIQQQIFNFDNNNVKSGMLINDLLYDNRSKHNNILDLPKKHERFNDLGVPTGLIVGCYNNNTLQSGGSSIDFAKQTDIDVITNDVFEKLLNQVSLKRKSVNETHKNNSTRRNTTKKRRV